MKEHEFSKWFDDVPSYQTGGLLKIRDDAPDKIKKEAREYDEYYYKRTGRHKLYFSK